MDNDIPILCGSLLNCLFQPCYMSLDLCTRLEPTSALFATKAGQFYRQLKQLDVKEFVAREKNVNWSRKIYHRCPNLTEIENVPFDKESLKRDTICVQLFSMMKSISCVSMEFQHFSPVVMLPMVGMASLSSLSLTTDQVPTIDPSFNLVPLEKFRVTSLKCDKLHLVDFCYPDHLNVLRFELPRVDVDELIEKLLNFRNLRELTVRLQNFGNSEQLVPLINFVSDVLFVDDFSLELNLSLYEFAFMELCEHAAVFEKVLSHLSLHYISAECVPNILQFSKLRSLSLMMGNLTFSLDVFLKSLPNLQHLEVECFSNVVSELGGAILVFKSIFDKRCKQFFVFLKRINYRRFSIYSGDFRGEIFTFLVTSYSIWTIQRGLVIVLFR